MAAPEAAGEKNWEIKRVSDTFHPPTTVVAVYRWFAQSTIRANSQDDSRRMIRAAGYDSRNSKDVSRKQAAMLCFFQINI